MMQASDVLAGLLKKAGAPDGNAAAGGAWPPGVLQLPDLFRVGQLVRCSVMGLTQVNKAARRKLPHAMQSKLIIVRPACRSCRTCPPWGQLGRCTVLGLIQMSWLRDAPCQMQC